MFATMLSKSFGVHRILAAAVVSVGVAGVPSVAQARHGLHIDIVLPFPQPVVVTPCPPPVVAEQPTGVEQTQQVWVAPVYQTVSDRQWVEPVTQTVTHRVWVPPTAQTVEHQVYFPDQYGYRRVATYDAYGRTYYLREYVLVTPAHYEMRTETVVVVPGHYQEVAEQQVVCEGHWTTVDRQVEVMPGHWETQVVSTPAYQAPATETVVTRSPF